MELQKYNKIKYTLFIQIQIKTKYPYNFLVHLIFMDPKKYNTIKYTVYKTK